MKDACSCVPAARLFLALAGTVAKELGKPRPIRGSPFKASSIMYVAWRLIGETNNGN